MLNEVKANITAMMSKTIEAYQQSLASVRVGRVHPSLLNQVKVDVYGSEMPLSSVANVSALDAMTLKIIPWDKTNLKSIAKALSVSEHEVNPVMDVDAVRVSFPPMTSERRETLVKLVRADAEKSRIALRQIRRDEIAALKAQVKAKSLSEDEESMIVDMVEDVFKRFKTEIDDMLKQKEIDIRNK